MGQAMIETTNKRLGLLETGLIDRVRRNHGLEHATLNILAERHPGKPMGGFSDTGGFWILGDIETEELTNAALEALKRLQAGEAKLAIHPGCGTNFATAGVLAGLAAGLTMFGVGRKLRDNLDRLPSAVLLATIAMIAAQPLGLKLQAQVTTNAVPGRLRVMDVRMVQQHSLVSHRVRTGE